MSFHFADFQKQFAEHIINGSSPSKLTEKIVPAGKLSIQEALQVYQNGYFARLTEALGETFEGVWFAAGDEEFFGLCRDYISMYPSSVYNLSEFGRKFPDFLRDSMFSDKSSDEAPFLADLAKFELLFQDVFNSQQNKAITAERLQAAGQDFRVEFGPAFALFESPFSVDLIWQQRKAKKPEMVEWNSPLKIMLFKVQGQLFIEAIPEPEFGFLKRLRSGQSVDLAASQTDFLSEQQISQLFQKLFKLGLIQEIVNMELVS